MKAEEIEILAVTVIGQIIDAQKNKRPGFEQRIERLRQEVKRLSEMTPEDENRKTE